MEGLHPEELYRAHKEEVEEIERLARAHGLPLEDVLSVVERLALESTPPRYVLEVLRDPHLEEQLTIRSKTQR